MVECKCDRPMVVSTEPDRCLKCGRQVLPVRPPDTLIEGIMHAVENPPGKMRTT